MFTGIITDIGTIIAAERSGEEMHLRIRTCYPAAHIPLGASIACSGICLTVTQTGEDWFAITASAETRRITTLDNWTIGTKCNLERALKMGDELGGHMVSGHVDGAAILEHIQQVGECYNLKLRAPNALAPFLLSKGSVALDGISLTINDVDGAQFNVMIIPHTWAHTTLAQRKAGDALNLEVDSAVKAQHRALAYRSSLT